MGALEDALAEIVKPLIDEIQGLKQKVGSLEETIQDLVPAGNRLWSYNQAAVKLGVKPSTVRSWMSQKKIETVTAPDGKTRISDSEVKRVLANACRP